MRVLIANLISNGDCLYITALARQIKQDHLDCHLTWAVSRQCANVLAHNEDIDELWKVDIPIKYKATAWEALEREVAVIQNGPQRFDRVYCPQLWPGSLRYFDSTIRPSQLRCYDRPLSVPIDPVIRLSDEEIAQTQEFVRRHRIGEYEHRILFECSPQSGQSPVTPTFATEVAEAVLARQPDICFILSTGEEIRSDNPAIVSAREVGIREHLELARHCSACVGVGSGLTVVTTCQSAPVLPNIQILDPCQSKFASFKYDFEYWSLPAERFVEMAGATVEQATEAVLDVCGGDLETARAKHERLVPLTFDHYLDIVDTWLTKRGRILEIMESLLNVHRRFGYPASITRYAAHEVLPLLGEEHARNLPRGRYIAEMFCDTFANL